MTLPARRCLLQNLNVTQLALFSDAKRPAEYLPETSMEGFTTQLQHQDAEAPIKLRTFSRELREQTRMGLNRKGALGFDITK